MRQRIIGVLFAVCLMISLLPATALAAATNVKVTGTTYYDSGALKSLTASFSWGTALAPSCLVLATQELADDQLTDLGSFGSKFKSFEEVKEHDKDKGTFGIISSTEEQEMLNGTNSLSIAFTETDLPLSIDKTYYIYQWTHWGQHCYPDALMCVIRVQDGAVQFSTDGAEFENLENEVPYSVTVEPAENMTQVTESGDEMQSGLKGAMTPVVYTANQGYEFPADYSVTAESGIMVRRDSATQITVLGTPTEDAKITLKAPTRKLPALEEVTFDYAYDVTRNEGYPARGTTISLTNLKKPIVTPKDSDNRGESAGSWTLAKAGTYVYVNSLRKANTDLTGIVNGIASAYSLTANEVVVHELKNSGTHIAYGVVIAYDAANGYALFLGDTWGYENGGAGYLLSTSEKTADFTITAGAVAIDFVPSREIALSPSDDYTFEGKAFGYGAMAPLTVTVSNNGNASTGALNVSLSGNNASSFELNAVDVDFSAGIAAAGSDTFAIAPKEGLSVGTYEATVTVSGVNVKSVSFSVSFTVKPAATYTVTYTDGVDGEEVFADKVSSGLANGVSTPVFDGTPSRSGYTFAGWEPEVAATVTGDATYTATWTPVYVPVTPAPEPVCPEDAACNCFADVDEDAWYHETIDWAVENGLLRGYDDGSNNVGPDDESTRAQIVTILWRAMGEPGATGEGAWYGDAFAWALEAGVIKGYNDDPTALGPNDEIAREQLAVILWRFAQLNGFDVSVGEDTNILSYEDADEISEWAIPAMQWAVGADIITGNDGNGLLEPGEGATRAEAMAMIERFDALYGLL